MKKLRVLCLHGFRDNAKFLEKEINKWDSSITHRLHMSFLDGPFSAGGRSNIEGIFPPPYYEWFQCLNFQEMTSANITNLDKGLGFVAEYMENNGPFDGLLGFSQGAVVCNALVGYQRKGAMLKSHPPIKFVVSIIGGKLKDPEMNSILYCPPMRCPSLHMIGDKDPSKEFGEEVLHAFVNPLVIRHPQGHKVPRLDGRAIELINHFLETVLVKKVEEEDGESTSTYPKSKVLRGKL